MIAIPVKTNTPETAIAPLFGKAKWFALVDQGGEITFWLNELKSGREVVNHFKTIGVDRVVFQDIGGNPYLMLNQAGIECYHSGHGRVLLAEALNYLRDKALIRVTPENMAEFVEQPHRHNKQEHKELHHCGDHDHPHEH